MHGTHHEHRLRQPQASPRRYLPDAVGNHPQLASERGKITQYGHQLSWGIWVGKNGTEASVIVDLAKASKKDPASTTEAMNSAGITLQTEDVPVTAGKQPQRHLAICRSSPQKEYNPASASKASATDRSSSPSAGQVILLRYTRPPYSQHSGTLKPEPCP